jgi:hypothetical protein
VIPRGVVYDLALVVATIELVLACVGGWFVVDRGLALVQKRATRRGGHATRDR